MEARLSRPVMPGDTLTVSIWETEPGTATFQTRVGDDVVLDVGRCTFVP